MKRTGGRGALIAGLIGLTLLLAAVVVAHATLSAGRGAAPPRLRVADLITRAGCNNGTVIDTQLYSYETGRCTLNGVEVTVAVFDSDQLRDRWLEAGQQFGGSFVSGNGWAAGTTGLDTANAFAAAVGPS